MLRAEITVNVKVIEDFNAFRKEMQKKVIENGLDSTLMASLQKLKLDLNYIVNTRVKETDATKTTDSLGNESVVLPKSDHEIIKYLTGVDISAVNRSKDYSTPIKDGVLVVDNFRVRLRLPISPYAEFDEVFAQAKKFFNEALFVIKDGAETKYLKNPGIDISQFVKVVCSTDTGDTEKSRNKFNKYRDSNKMPRQGYSEIGHYAEWSLKQDGMKSIMHPNSGFVNLTDVVKKIKEGNIDDAIEIAKNLKDKSVSVKTTEQVEKLKNTESLNPTTKAYLNLVRLIKNLTIQKQIYEGIITYSLASNFEGSADDVKEDALYQELQQNMNLWSIGNQNVWFNELIKVAEKAIQEFYKVG